MLMQLQEGFDSLKIVLPKHVLFDICMRTRPLMDGGGLEPGNQCPGTF